MSCRFDFVNDCDRQDALLIGRAYTKTFTVLAENLAAWSCRWVVFDGVPGAGGAIKADWRTGDRVAVSFVTPDTLATLTLSAAQTALLASGSWSYYAELFKAGENPLTLGEGRIDFIDRPGAE